MLAEDFIPLTPRSFFGIEGEIHYAPWPGAEKKTVLGRKKTYAVPNTAEFGGDSNFAEVCLAWNEKGLIVEVFYDEPFGPAYFPDYQRGDAIELFIDTRDVKSSGFNTRFCHHFYVLPSKVKDTQAGELTRFRTEDKHELCDPSLIAVHSMTKSSLRILLPADCLHGFDPKDFDRLGFNYKLSQRGRFQQHFSAQSMEYPIEQQPALWASMRLVK